MPETPGITQPESRNGPALSQPDRSQPFTALRETAEARDTATERTPPACGPVDFGTSADGGIRLARGRCKQWKCDYCAERLKKRLMAKAAAGRPNVLLTLTTRRGSYASPDQAAEAMRDAWALMRRRICRRYGLERVEFVGIWESHQSGWPHLHILAKLPFIPQRWLSAVWQELTGSPIVDIRYVRQLSQVVAYVAKYVAKRPARFGVMRRWWTSWRWAADVWKTERAAGRWIRLATRAETVAGWYIKQGYEVIADAAGWFVAGATIQVPDG